MCPAMRVYSTLFYLSRKEFLKVVAHPAKVADQMTKASVNVPLVIIYFMLHAAIILPNLNMILQLW